MSQILSAMNSDHVHQVDMSALNFEIYISPFQAICGNKIMPVKHHMAVCSENSLLGVRSQDKEEFVINHMNAYLLAESLYNSIYQSGIAHICYLSESKNWMASIIGEPKYKTNGHFAELPSDVFITDRPKSTILKDLFTFGFKPAIGVVNGFDYNDDLGFYLLLEPSTASTKDDMHLMTLDAFKFSPLDLQALVKISDIDEQLEKARNILLGKAVNKFQETLEAFIQVYEKLSCWQTQADHLTAICLDVFNKNRNIESVKADTQLSKELSTFINKAETYFRNANQMSDLVQFIIRYHDVDFSAKNLDRNKVEQIFVKKKSYGKIVRVLGEMKPTQKSYHDYLESQLSSYRQVYEFLKRLPRQSALVFQ